MSSSTIMIISAWIEIEIPCTNFSALCLFSLFVWGADGNKYPFLLALNSVGFEADMMPTWICMSEIQQRACKWASSLCVDFLKFWSPLLFVAAVVAHPSCAHLIASVLSNNNNNNNCNNNKDGQNFHQPIQTLWHGRRSKKKVFIFNENHQDANLREKKRERESLFGWNSGGVSLLDKKKRWWVTTSRSLGIIASARYVASPPCFQCLPC